ARPLPRPQSQRPAVLRPQHQTSHRVPRHHTLMFDTASKAFFHLLAGTPPLKKLASRYGMRRPSSFARRFIAGETIAEAIDAARAVESRGLTITLDHLGESLRSLAQADAATRASLDIIQA